MKNTIIALALLVSGSALAQNLPPTHVIPVLFKYSRSVELQAYNPNRDGVMCSGFVSLRLASGQNPSVYVSMYVPANGYRNHRINLTDIKDRVMNASHSVWCN